MLGGQPLISDDRADNSFPSHFLSVVRLLCPVRQMPYFQLRILGLGHVALKFYPF